MSVDLSQVLLGQWQNSPRILAIITELVQPARDEAISALDRILFYQFLDNAEGVWLERIGAIVGLDRPSTTDPAQDERFGFDLAGQPFDQAPFRGASANDAVYPLPDALYQKLIRARAIVVLGDGTTQTLTRAIRAIDPTASVKDNRDMTIRVVTANKPLLELADDIGALPRSAGVDIVYADRLRFGFDRAGVPYDQGPFVGE